MLAVKLKNLKFGKIYLIGTIVLIFCMILLGVRVRFFMYIAFAVACTVTVVLSDRDSLYLLFFFMPFASVFIPDNGQTSFYTYFEIFFIFSLFMKTGKKDYESLLLFLTYAANIITISFLRLRYDLSITYTFKHIINIVLLYYFTLQKLNKEESIRLLKFYIAGVLLSSLTGLLRLNWENLQELVGELIVYSNGSFRFSGLYKDPNMYTALLFSAVTPILILNAKKKVGWVWAAIALCCMFFGFLTDSKSFLLICLIVSVIYISMMIKSKQYRMLLIFFSIGAIMVGICEIKYGLVSSIVQRFGEGFNINKITTGRFNIWQDYLKAFASDLSLFLFGAGVGAPKPNGNAAHNIILEIIYNFGIFGGIILIFMLWLIFVSERKNFRRGFCNYITLIIMVVLFFFLSGIMLYETGFYYMICYLMYDLNIDDQKEDIVLRQSLY